ncbi:hypothetical protein F5890DRAFT_1494248 [Lentinula detonsa]|uniref:Uncharacterized protein n=1 Tax=Lentinula detonsa TaxID=2804962 RepID=A0AA38Q642_9AGAR|nr:hypothetical protein F5890DRAFT_1494248 [Lentinula detonsa]
MLIERADRRRSYLLRREGRGSRTRAANSVGCSVSLSSFFANRPFSSFAFVFPKPDRRVHSFRATYIVCCLYMGCFEAGRHVIYVRV